MVRGGVGRGGGCGVAHNTLRQRCTVWRWAAGVKENVKQPSEANNDEETCGAKEIEEVGTIWWVTEKLCQNSCG